MSCDESEYVIYESTEGDFLSGYSQNRLKIVHKQSNNTSRTTVRYYDENNIVTEEKTSDNLVKLIGQENYNLLFTALSSVLSLEIKVRAILAILTENELSSLEKIPIEQDSDNIQCKEPFKIEDIAISQVKSIKTEKRARRRPKTYVVTKTIEENETLTLNDDEIDIDSEVKQEILNNITKLAELQKNPETGTNKISRQMEVKIKQKTTKTESTPILIPKFEKQEISPGRIKMPDGSLIMVSRQPEDYFHIATPEVLKDVTSDERKRLINYQMFIDWKYCLERNEDGYLPLHLAVLFNDIPLLKRQCFMLIRKQESVDIPAENMTALQMSLTRITDRPDTRAMSILLNFGADPLYCDDEEKTILHLASEQRTDHLRVILEFCKENARRILQENNTLWQPSMESLSDSELATHLLDHMCSAVDAQGYTPLMLASHLGIPTNVSLLADASPTTINKGSGNSGSTAFFLAVEAACLDAIRRGNKSIVADKFAETLSILIEKGANHTIKNNSDTSVDDLLLEHTIPALSKLFNYIVTKKKTNCDQTIDFSKYMILKENGKLTVTDIGHKNKKKSNKTGGKKEKRVAAKNKEPKVRKQTKKTANLKAADVIIQNNPEKNIVVIKNTTEKLQETASTSQNVIKIPQNKPIVLKKSTLNSGLIISSQLKNNIIYLPNKGNVNNISNPTSSGSNSKITIQSDVKLTPQMLKRPSTNIMLSQVKKKKDSS